MLGILRAPETHDLGLVREYAGDRSIRVVERIPLTTTRPELAEVRRLLTMRMNRLIKVLETPNTSDSTTGNSINRVPQPRSVSTKDSEPGGT